MGTSCPNRIEQILSERLPEEIATFRDFERWFEPLKLRVEVAVWRVHADVTTTLETARQRVLEREGGLRDVWLTGEEA